MSGGPGDSVGDGVGDGPDDPGERCPTQQGARGVTLAADAQGFVHATTVAIDGQGVLLFGPSGAGKSALALQLIGLGARLVADDRTRVVAGGDAPMGFAPKELTGLIEARGVGMVRVPHVSSAPIVLAVDLAQVEPARLPPARPVTFVANQSVKTLWRVDLPAFPSAIFHLVKHGGYDHGDDRA